MQTGMLWFDDDPGRTLEDKVLKAAAYYQHKYHQRPNLCLVHPSALNGNGKTAEVGGVEVSVGRSVLPDHFWLWQREGED